MTTTEIRMRILALQVYHHLHQQEGCRRDCESFQLIVDNIVKLSNVRRDEDPASK